jgi:hypothetical protein
VNVVTKTELDKMLEYPGARDAFKRLVKGGADQGTLGNLLVLRKIFGDTPEHKRWLPARRSVNSVSAKMRALAAQIQELRRFPGIFGEIFPTITVDQRIDIRFSPDRLHESWQSGRSRLER